MSFDRSAATQGFFFFEIDGRPIRIPAKDPAPLVGQSALNN